MYIVKGPDGGYVHEVLPTGEILSTDELRHAVQFEFVCDAQAYMYMKGLSFPSYIITGLDGRSWLTAASTR